MSSSSGDVFHDIDWHPQIQCVQRDDVEGLKQLLESGRSINVTDDHRGNTPLHHAVLEEKYNVFNFMLSLQDLQINKTNYHGQTPLLISMDCKDEIYAQRLLQLGADPNIGTHDDMSPLHQVESAKVAKMLIENGANINAQTFMNGETPLYSACIRDRGEIAHLLLYYGANPTIPDKSGLTCLNRAMVTLRSELAQILLQYFIEIDKVAICLHDFYVAMKYCSDIFPEMFNACTNIFYTNVDLETFAEDLLDLAADCFKHFIVKFKTVLVDMFEHVCKRHRYSSTMKYVLPDDFELGNCISNLNSLDENNLLTDTVNLLLGYCDYFVNFDFITDRFITYDEQVQLILSLISHGLPLKFESLFKVYKTFGYCELFRILLYCDLCDNYIPRRGHGSRLMVALISEVPLTIEYCIKSPEKYIFESSVLDLLDQFALWKLQQFCMTTFQMNEAIQAKLKTLPTVPKLLELARNATRRHIVQKFEMTCSRHLYTYIDCLKISQVYKDILCFKKKLYL